MTLIRSTLLAAALTLGISAPIALAAGSIDSAAADLRGGASVYVDPAAQLPLSAADAAALSSQISDTRLLHRCSPLLRGYRSRLSPRGT